MKIKEITESIGNGSFFRYGPKPPKGPNDMHPCVDQNDPNCPGHKAGLNYQLANPHDPVSADEDLTRPSFRNGRLQAQLMTQKGWQAIAATISKNPNAREDDLKLRQQAQVPQQIIGAKPINRT
jgi:hypothetical protein